MACDDDDDWERFFYQDQTSNLSDLFGSIHQDGAPNVSDQNQTAPNVSDLFGSTHQDGVPNLSNQNQTPPNLNDLFGSTHQDGASNLSDQNQSAPKNSDAGPSQNIIDEEHNPHQLLDEAVFFHRRLEDIRNCFKLRAELEFGEALIPDRVIQKVDTLVRFLQLQDRPSMLIQARKILDLFKPLLLSGDRVEDTIKHVLDNLFSNLDCDFGAWRKDLEIRVGKRAMEETNPTEAVMNVPNRPRKQSLTMERVDEVVAQFGQPQDTAAKNLDVDRSSLSRFVKKKLNIEPWPGQPKEGNIRVHVKRSDDNVHQAFEMKRFDGFSVLSEKLSWVYDFQLHSIEYQSNGKWTLIKDDISWKQCIECQVNAHWPCIHIQIRKAQPKPSLPQLQL